MQGNGRMIMIQEGQLKILSPDGRSSLNSKSTLTSSNIGEAPAFANRGSRLRGSYSCSPLSTALDFPLNMFRNGWDVLHN